MKKLLAGAALSLLSAVACWAAEPAFTLALQAYTFNDRTMVETIEVAKRLGFKAIELTGGQKLGGPFQGAANPDSASPETVTAVRAYLDACGIQAVSYGVAGAGDEAGWRRQFEFVRALGIGMLIVEPPPEQLPLLDRLAQEYKIRVHIHNHGKSDPWWDPAFMVKQVAASSEWIGAGPDIGHWVPVGIKPAEGIKQLAASRIFSMHFVDVDAAGQPVPYGTGVSDLASIMATLKAKGAPVLFTCEYEKWDVHQENNVRACVKWFNEAVKTLDDGGAGWISLFDGKTFNGWKVGKNADSFRIEDGAIVVNGNVAHLFYDGDTAGHEFKNFHFKADVMTFPGSNSGIYFHTRYQEEGFPRLGMECQVNNSHTDWRRTGSLYNLNDLREVPAKDNEWFTQEIIVKGTHVEVKVDGRTILQHTFPDETLTGEYELPTHAIYLPKGTFALQGHDPKSKVLYKNIQVKLLD
ncbi:MAG: DUF1080 domain-containing protein [Verrucomicrobiota bacterium]|jgi:sugar phosphate isomerase/epimerase|nr:DUF1080 domain-containing protein [Verrucomicrobiota bacterium]